MCGISGIIGNIEQHDHKIINHFLLKLKHRGPDDSGIHRSENILLGHNRLSILDLSKKASQPMTSLNERFVISYNGEIYNYLELKKKFNLKIEKNFGDTRVLSELFSKLQLKSLDSLRGMFAIAVWDKFLKKLYLIRDRFGIKPIYYYQKQKKFFFSSEIGPLLDIVENKKINKKIVNDYLDTSLLDHTEETFFEGIKQIMPGSLIVVDHKAQITSKERWYKLEHKIHKKITKCSVSEDNSNFKKLFNQSINIHSRSDVKIGLSISGGLDSKAILASFNNLKEIKKVDCLNFYFNSEEHSENDEVKKILKLKKNIPHYLLQKNNIFSNFNENILTQEQPFGGVATMAMRNLYNYSKNVGIKVMFNGAGADDYLAGSNREIFSHLINLKKTNNSQYEKNLNYYCKLYSVKERNIEKKLSEISKKKFHGIGADGTDASNPFILKKKDYKFKDIKYSDNFFKNSLLSRMLSNKLPRTLRYEDRNSMGASIETRVPFLDHELVEFCLNLKDSRLVDLGMGKIILRNFLSQKYGNSIFNEKKFSIQTPQTKWLTTPTSRKKILHILKDKNSILNDFINVKKAYNFVESDLFPKINNSNFIWQWISLHEWNKKFF